MSIYADGMTYREVPISEAQREMIGDRVVIQLPTPILSAEVQRFSPTAALLILHAQHCRAAVIGALEGLRDYEVHQRVLAELCIYYDLQERLVRLLESAMDELLFDVISLPTEHLDAQLASRVALASDMARSVRAKRAALEFLEDTQ